MQFDRLLDCSGENCPMPLVKTREMIMNSSPGEIVKIVGTHPQSFDEIPMALEAQGKSILEKGREDEGWYIIFRV